MRSVWDIGDYYDLIFFIFTKRGEVSVSFLAVFCQSLSEGSVLRLLVHLRRSPVEGKQTLHEELDHEPFTLLPIFTKRKEQKFAKHMYSPRLPDFSLRNFLKQAMPHSSQKGTKCTVVTNSCFSQFFLLFTKQHFLHGIRHPWCQISSACPNK